MNGMQRSDRIVAITIAILLTAGCIVVLYPFVSALLWAVILCFVTWPTFLWVVRLLGGRRTLAATLMALLAAALLVAPFVAVGLSLADNVSHLTTVISRALEHGLPDLPTWVADIPLVGHRLHTGWQALTQDSARLTTALQRLAVPVIAWLLSQGVALGAGVLSLSLSVLLLFFLYRDGAALATRLQEVTGRIAGARAQQFLDLAVSTIRGVVYGILGSMLAQGILAGVGFLVAGVPGALLLGSLTLVLSVVPGGPALLWLPASLWLYKQDAVGWAIFLALWGVLEGIGGLLNATFGNAAEHATAVTAALGNRMELALGIAVGSSVQIALFVTPVLVLASLGFGPQPMDLVFFPGLVLTVFFAVLVLGQVSGDGQSNWIKGVQLLAVYLILAIVFYFAPGKASQ